MNETPNSVAIASMPDASDPAREAERLRQGIELSRGSFSLLLAEYDLPRQRRFILRSLREAFPKLNVAHVTLIGPADARATHNVLDQLRERVAAEAHQPDVLVVTGYETWFPPNPDSSDDATGRALTAAIQPFNLGREHLRDEFPCPFVLCLPTKFMAALLRFAPDLTSWRSGFLQFYSDMAAVLAEIEREANIDDAISPDDAPALDERLSELIEDAKVLSVPSITLARLYGRLGQVLVGRHDISKAHAAFQQMAELAADDSQLLEKARAGIDETERLARDFAPGISLDFFSQPIPTLQGVAFVSDRDKLFGREEELQDLFGRVTSLRGRFLAVWGETGSGKSSLVLAGVVPQLRETSQYLPIVVRRWDQPLPEIRRVLARETGLAWPDDTPLVSCVHDAVEKTGRTLVFVLDQFELFFLSNRRPSERKETIEFIGDCYKRIVQCRFLFVIREDFLGRLAEFDNLVDQPLGQEKRFEVRPFDDLAALRVLKNQAKALKFEWSDEFLNLVVEDLTQDGRVSPIELQLVFGALVLAKIRGKDEYIAAGRKNTLLENYLELELEAACRMKFSLWDCTRVLCALTEPTGNILRTNEFIGRPALTLDEIARKAEVETSVARTLLETLTERHIIAKTEDETDLPRYELVHDALIKLTPLQAERRETDFNAIVYFLWDAVNQPSRSATTIVLTKAFKENTYFLNRVKKIALTKALSDPDKKVQQAALVVIAAAVKADFSLAKQALDAALPIATQNDPKDRLGNVRRATLAVIAAAFKADSSLAKQALDFALPIATQNDPKDQRGNVRSAAPDVIVAAVKADSSLAKQALDAALPAITTQNDPFDRHAALAVIAAAVKADSSLAKQALDFALPIATQINQDYFVRSAALDVIAAAVKADFSLAKQALDAALPIAIQNDPKDRLGNVRRAALAGIAAAVEADSSLAKRALDAALLMAQNDPSSLVRYTALAVLAAAFKANPALVQKAARDATLRANTTQNDPFVQRAALDVIATAVEADSSLAKQALDAALPIATQEIQDESVLLAVLNVIFAAVKADSSLAKQALDFALPIATQTNQDDSVRSAALAVIAEASKTEMVRGLEALTSCRFDKDDREIIADGIGAGIAERGSKEPDPVGFLFDHLEGRRSFRPRDNPDMRDANSCPDYRQVIIRAIAHYLNDEKTPKEQFDAIKHRLDWMRDNETRLHRRIAAWDALIAYHELKE